MTEMLHTGKKVNSCIDTKFNVEANTSRSASAQRKLTEKFSFTCTCSCMIHYFALAFAFHMTVL